MSRPRLDIVVHNMAAGAIVNVWVRAHDWEVNRGNSLIAGVVLIGILGSLSIALQATTPQTKFEQVAVQQVSQVATTHAAAEKPPEIVCVPGFTYKSWNQTKSGKTDVVVECAPIVGYACGKTFGDSSGATEEAYKKAGALPSCIENVKNGTMSNNKDHSACKIPEEGQPQCPNLEHCFKTVNGRPADCRKLKNSTIPAGKGFVPENNQHFGLKQLADSAAGGNPDDAKLLGNIMAQPNMRPALDSAFGEQVAEQAEKVKALNQEWCYECTSEEMARLQKAKDDEQKKLEATKALQARLAKDVGGIPVPCPEKPCPSGTTPPPGPGADTRDTGDRKSGNQGNTFGKSMGNALGKLLGGNQQTQNSAANRAAQQAAQQQQCQPRHFCANNTLYWGSQNSYSYNQSYENYNDYSSSYNYGSTPTSASCPTQVVQQCQNGCASGGTQCNGGGQGGGSTATLSCGGGALFDVGASVPISYSCANAVSSTGSGFSTEGAISGTASTTIQKPPAGADIVSYGLTCTASNNQTSSARCDVKINVTSIVLVANPKQVANNATSTIGWVTRGMKTCVISSPGAAASSTLEEFNEDNADIENVSGIAVTPPLTTDTDFTLSCVTKADQPKSSTIKVRVGS